MRSSRLILSGAAIGTIIGTGQADTCKIVMPLTCH
jgi:hypothetical protein